MTTVELMARKSFHFHSVVNSHGWRQLAPCRFEDDIFHYVDHLSTRLLGIDARFSGVAQREACHRAAKNGVSTKVWLSGFGIGNIMEAECTNITNSPWRAARFSLDA